MDIGLKFAKNIKNKPIAKSGQGLHRNMKNALSYKENVGLRINRECFKNPSRTKLLLHRRSYNEHLKNNFCYLCPLFKCWSNISTTYDTGLVL